MSTSMILLASYPKSGNTWLRILLSNLLYPAEAPISINDIRVGGFACDRRELFDQLAPWDASDLNLAQVDTYIPEVYREALLQRQQPVYLKTHDMARLNPQGEWIFPGDCVAAAIHIVRHPLDVLPSYAKHFGLSHAEALECMLAPEQRSSKPLIRDKRRLPEQHGSWREHTASWQDPELPFPVYRARYEDLRRNPQQEFGRLLRAIGLNFSEQELATALEYSSFQALQQQESHSGFKERLRKSAAPFFRKGVIGSGRQEVEPELQQRLLETLATELTAWGYDSEQP